MKHPQNQRLAADRTEAFIDTCLSRLQLDPAFAVAVHMVFSLFGVKFDGALEVVTAVLFEGCEDGLIG